MDLLDVTLKIAELEAEKHRLDVQYEKDKRRIAEEMETHIRAKNIMTSNFDYDKITRVKEIMNFTGIDRWFGVGDTTKVVADTIRDLAAGGSVLRRKYSGCKNYEGFTCQSSSHDYGMGPSHGTIVFSMGFKNFYLKQINDPAVPIPTETINDILYVLHLIRGDQKFRETVFGGIDAI